MIRGTASSRHLFLCTAAVVCLCIMPMRADGSGVGGMPEERLRHHLTESEELFRKAVELDRTDPRAARDYYTRSVLHLERIIEEGGVRNGKLFYNIGNIYFRLGDLGRAILGYKRAALYTPNDPNLRQNLDYARSRRVDRIEKKQAERVFKTVFFFHYDIARRVKFLLFAASFAVTWIAAATLLFIKAGSIRVLLAASSVVCVLFLVSLTVEAISLEHSPSGVVIAGEVIARKGDAETYQPSFTEPLHAGTEFTLVENRPNWWHVELEDGVRCWIPAADGELVSR